MLRRLRIKFVCINMSIVTIMLIVIFAVVFHITRVNLRNESFIMLRSAALNVPRPDKPGKGPDNPHQPFFIIEVDHDGNVVSAESSFFDISDEDFVEYIAKSALEVTEKEPHLGEISEFDLRCYREIMPPVERIAFDDISSEKKFLKDMLKNCLIIGLVSFVLFFIISWNLASIVVHPVDRAWDQQKQFVADASHELKTPLTVIITNAELLQDPSYDEEHRESFLDNILVMSKRMRQLTDSLLELTRVDNGMAVGALESVDFSTLVNRTVLRFEPVYYEKGLTLTGDDIEEGIVLKGNAVRLRQVVGILLDNAQKYSSENAEISVSLKKQGSRHCLLTVVNPGDAISQEDLKNIFKRFYRVDKARAGSGGYGLGLSIAEGIVSDFGGKIWAGSENGLNSFYVQLPLQQ